MNLNGVNDIYLIGKKPLITILFLLFSTIFLFQTADAAIYGSISGKVISEDSSIGLEGIAVDAKLKDKNFSDVRYGTVTDKNGKYVLNNLKEGSYALTFSAVSSRYITPEKAQIEVALQKGKKLTNVNFVLPFGASISGVVLEADGITPIRNIFVNYSINSPDPAWGSIFGGTDTDENGSFHFSGLPKTDSLSITVEILGHASVRKSFKVARGQEIRNVTFVVKRDDVTGVHGVVRSLSDKRPIKDATVIIRNLSGGDGGSTSTDSEGKYSLVGLTPGNYKITAFEPRGESYVTRNILIEFGRSTEVNFDIAQVSASFYDILRNIFSSLRSMVVSDAEASFVSDAEAAPSTSPLCGKFRAITSGPYSCNDDQFQALTQACNKAKQVADNSSCFANDDSREKVKEWFYKKSNAILCEPARCGECAKTEGKKMTICPETFTEKSCGCSEAIFFHETTHLTQFFKDEEASHRCSVACFNCAKPPKDYEYVCGRCRL